MIQATAHQLLLLATELFTKLEEEKFRDVSPELRAELQSKSRHDAETLLCHLAGWKKIDLLLNLAQPVSSDISRRFEEAVQERLTGMPLQYIIGAAPFYGRLFQVRPGCLIPRPETEVLVEKAVDWLNQHAPHANVLDLGTGSGILAITIAIECPSTHVQAVDISADAYEIAKGNALLLGAGVTFRITDGLELLNTLTNEGEAKKLQVLVSNPPYIPSVDVTMLDDEVRLYEPTLALDGGDDGLDYYRSIASTGDGFFASGPAALFFEVGAGQAEDVITLYQKQHAERWEGWKFEVVPDLRGIGRVVFGERL